MLTDARCAEAGNAISDAGATAIAEALLVNTTLATIYLGRAYGSAGARAARGARRAAGPLLELPSCF